VPAQRATKKSWRVSVIRCESPSTPPPFTVHRETNRRPLRVLRRLTGATSHRPNSPAKLIARPGETPRSASAKPIASLWRSSSPAPWRNSSLATWRNSSRGLERATFSPLCPLFPLPTVACCLRPVAYVAKLVAHATNPTTRNAPLAAVFKAFFIASTGGSVRSSPKTCFCSHGKIRAPHSLTY